jgi:hypothetical protein
VLRECTRIKDYDVLTNIYTAIGGFVLSKNEYVKKKAVELGCLELLLISN